MKKLFWIFASTLLLSNLFLSTGCGDDTTTDNDLAPVVSTTSTTETVLGQDGNFTVTVNATQGTNALKALSVFEDGTKVDASRLQIDGVAAASNPILIVGPTATMTWDITVDVQFAFDTRTYTFKVEDDKGLSDEVAVDVTVEEPLDETITGAQIRLYNQAGAVGHGGIDLDDGASTGTSLHAPTSDDSYLLAELRDLGIDSLAGSGDNWKRAIGGINGTEVRYVGNATTVTDVNFDNVASKEAIESIFDATDELPVFGGNWGDYKAKGDVQIGDIFAVYKDSPETYYLVLVEDINETTTLGDNTDYYQVTIKY